MNDQQSLLGWSIALLTSSWLEMSSAHVHSLLFHTTRIPRCTIFFLVGIQLTVFTFILGTCEASWFDFESYVRFEIRFVLMVRFESNHPRCQSSFVKKRLVVV